MAAALNLTFPVAAIDADGDYYYEVWATPQKSAGISRPSEGQYRRIALSSDADITPQPGSSPDPAIWDVLAPYAAKYGALIAGRKIFFKLRVLTAGNVVGGGSKGSVSDWFYFAQVVS